MNNSNFLPGMNNKDGIFIFTKDRSQSLKKTLTSISKTKENVYLIDDSAEEEHQIANRKLFNNFPQSFYLGKNEFYRFINQHRLSSSEFSFLLREPGVKEWNLGFMRNFALLTAKSLGLERVLFVDDDIQVNDSSLINELFNLISSGYDFAGANITGMEDLSIIDFISKDLGRQNVETMLSGGFLAFKPSKINHYFLNRYNEDWIWLSLHLKNNRTIQIGSVSQTLTDPFYNYKEKVFFQEFGEIILEGILKSRREDSNDVLLSLKFWKESIKLRRNHLDELLSVSKGKNKLQYVEIIGLVKTHLACLDDARIFKSLFQIYFKNHSAFRRFYDSL